MEVIGRVPGVSFETARELPNSTVRPATKSVGHKSSGNGTRKKNNKVTLPGKMAADLAKIDQEITAENKRILVIEADGRRHFMKITDLRARAS